MVLSHRRHYLHNGTSWSTSWSTSWCTSPLLHGWKWMDRWSFSVKDLLIFGPRLKSSGLTRWKLFLNICLFGTAGLPQIPSSVQSSLGMLIEPVLLLQVNMAFSFSCFGSALQNKFLIICSLTPAVIKPDAETFCCFEALCHWLPLFPLQLRLKSSPVRSAVINHQGSTMEWSLVKAAR